MGENGKEIKDLEVLQPRMDDRLTKFTQFMALYNSPYKAGKLAGYTDRYGYQLMRREDVQEAIAYWKDAYTDPTISTPEKAAIELARMAYVDIADYVEEDWTFKTPRRLTKAQRAALTGLEVIRKKDGLTVKPKWSKTQALEILARMHGMLSEGKKEGTGLTLNIAMVQQTSAEAHGQQMGHVTIAGLPVPQEPEDT